MVQSLWKTAWQLLTKLTTEIPHDPASPFPEELQQRFQQIAYTHIQGSVSHKGKAGGGHPSVHRGMAEYTNGGLAMRGNSTQP